MRRSRLATIAALILAMSMALTGVAVAQGTDFAADYDSTANLEPVGSSPRPVPLTGAGSGLVNSDLAYWGDMAIQGTYEGFRLIDISDPTDPTEINNYTGCVEGTTVANQGDIVVWDDLLVRALNSPAGGGGFICGGVQIPQGEEGSVVFDISDPAAPVGVAFIPAPCGTHTLTGVPDLANDRLLIYSSASSNSVGCRGISIMEIPLDDPEASSYLRLEPSGEPVPAFPNLITVDAPSSAAGTYAATGAAFGPHAGEAGIDGPIVLVNDGTALPNEGCSPLVGFPAGAIALVDRGTCPFLQKTTNAQAAGAVAVIVANNSPAAPITLGGDDPAHLITIPSGMITQADGNAIKAGLPASGTFASEEMPEDPERACHDTGVILGKALLAACAGHDGFSVWTLDPRLGGSLEDPELLYSHVVDPGVTIGHSAAFSWDGQVLIFGHEPGGGGQAQCQATSSDINKTLFFFEARTGTELGRFLHPRPQTNTENCTWHNYNVVPSNKGNLLVSGNYQSGISVLDFTDPSDVEEVAYADPDPLSDTQLIGGGDWSSYWYNGYIYESDMKRGLHVWQLRGNFISANARQFPHSNPQTMETSFPVRWGVSGD